MWNYFETEIGTFFPKFHHDTNLYVKIHISWFQKNGNLWKNHWQWENALTVTFPHFSHPVPKWWKLLLLNEVKAVYWRTWKFAPSSVKLLMPADNSIPYDTVTRNINEHVSKGWLSQTNCEAIFHVITYVKTWERVPIPFVVVIM